MRAKQGNRGRAPARPRGKAQTRAALPVPSAGLLSSGIAPLSHGYVHEPYPGAWQRNRELMGPNGVFSAVWACVQTIAQDFGKLEPHILKQLPNGAREEYPQHPAARVCWYPNRYQTRVDFWGQYMMSALYMGNAYVLLAHDARNVIEAMHILDPRLTQPLIAPDGSIWYRTSQKQIVEEIGLEYIPARSIMHHRLLCLHHPLIGVTPIYAAAYSAAMGTVIQQNSLNFFSNMSRASGVLTMPGNVSKDDLARMKAEWEQNYKQTSLGSVAILQGGLKWEPLTINAEDSQLIEQLRWNVEDVARCFRVPLYMISDASKISYKNSEQLARAYYSQTLQYHLESIEARLDSTFGLANDVWVEFDLEKGLFRSEVDVRFAAYQVAISSGVMTINEARSREQLPPKAGGDEPLVQKQYVPLSKLRELAEAELAPPPPPPEGLEDAEEETEEQDEDDLADVEESVRIAEVLQRRAQQWLTGTA